MLNIFETVAFAEGTAATTQAGAVGMGGSMPMLVSMVLVIGLMYFMMIRPQRKKEKELKAMINAMKVGDKVVTIGGICGKVVKIKDEFVFIESGNVGTPDEKCVIKMERDSIKTVEASKK